MTVALGTNIANPISTALSQWPGFDTMGKLANYGKLGATDPDAAIKALFAAGEQGAWYDPSDLTTMFQDRAGTTPVTADGQTVGKILDKSGRGNHATAPSDAARPLYKTSGGLSWLQFDGVDDSLSTGNINFTGTDKMSWFHGSKINTTTLGIVCETSVTVNANQGTFNSYYNDASTGGIVARANKLGLVTGPAEVAVAAPNTSVYTFNANFAELVGGQAIRVRRNAATYSNGGTFAAGAATFGNYPLYVGARGGSSLPLNGNIYSLIVRGALSTTQEITDTETWVNSKTGAY